MKAILIAAGEGRRMRPLTLTTPKPMIRVLGKPLLHWIIQSLPAAITEIVIVIGYKGEQIKEYFGDRCDGRSIRYVWQEKQLGTGHALHLCRELVAPGERFLFMFADDLHSTEAMEKLIARGIGMLGTEHEDPRRFGVLEVDSQGRVVGIEEKPQQPKSKMVAVGVYMLDSRFFEYPMPLSGRGEYEYAEPLRAMLKDVPVMIERTPFWHPVGQPEDIDALERILHERAGGGAPTAYATPVIIIAGGRGTRLPREEQDKPKCLVEIAGKPILAWQLEELRRQGFNSIRLALGYKAEMVIDWLTTSGNTQVQYSVEKEPLGTGGGLKLAAQGISVPFIAFNCDDLADVSFAALIRHSCDGQYNVITGKPFSGAYTFDSVICDSDKRVREFKQRSPDIAEAIVNIGHYYLRPDIFEGMPDSFSNEKDLFPRLAKEGKLVLHTHTGYWLTANNAEQIKGTRDFFAKQ